MIREPIVSGTFYRETRESLLTEIDRCESGPLGSRNEKIEPRGKLIGMILPHAGYTYSGSYATWGIKRLSMEKPLPLRFLLLGPKHRSYRKGAAVSTCKAWQTPLGRVPLDEDLRQALIETGDFLSDDEGHSQEHSLEVELPFLQKLYGKETFSIVPVAFQYHTSIQEIQKWGNSISKLIFDPKFSDVCTIVSSDFSHETPRQEAYKLDSEAIDLIEKIDPEGFHQLVTSEERSICGFSPISVLLSALKGKKVKGRRLKYYTSMDVIQHPAGVGYASIIFEGE